MQWGNILTFLIMACLLVILIALFYMVLRDAAVKRMLHPFITFFSAFSMAAIIYAVLSNWVNISVPAYCYAVIFLLIIALAIVFYRRVGFCDTCGKTFFHPSIREQHDRCPKCGTRLGHRRPPR